MHHNFSCDSSEIKTLSKAVTKLSNAVDKLQSDVINIVANIEQLPTQAFTDGIKESSESSPKSIIGQARPTFHNPSDIPHYDAIDTIEVIEVSVHSNDSVNTTDDLVPELEENSDLDTQYLNSLVPTSQQ